MNRDYAERRIREALKASGGNTTKARQTVIAWALEDTKLLHELVAPHLTGIAAHAVNRVLTLKEKPAPEAPPQPVTAAKETRNDPFGMEILKAIALGNPAQFGQESASAPVRRQAASQRHIDAIRQMVSKDKTKK